MKKTLQIILIASTVIIFSYLLSTRRELFDDTLASLEDFFLTKDGNEEQRLLDFFVTINTSAKEQLAKHSSCDDKVHAAILNNVLDGAYRNLHEQHSESTNTREHDTCVSAANYLCETTSPFMYMTQSRQGHPKPTNTNLNCYNQMYDCCRRRRKN